jgi:histidinol phosphatase-like enzyme
MYGDEDQATRDLINWGILQRNNVNEVLPTVDFLVWVNDTMIGTAMDGGLSYIQDLDEFEPTEVISGMIRDAIVMWTSQKGKDKQIYAKLDVGKHTNIVREIIQEISQRLNERYHTKIGNKRPIYYDEETGVCANPNEGETLEDFHRKIEEYKTRIKIQGQKGTERRKYRTTEELEDIIKEQREKKLEKNLEEAEENESKKAKPSEFDTKLDSY